MPPGGGRRQGDWRERAGSDPASVTAVFAYRGGADPRTPGRGVRGAL